MDPRQLRHRQRYDDERLALLQESINATVRELRQLGFYGYPTDVKVEAYTAKRDEHVIVAPPTARDATPVYIWLPGIETGDPGYASIAVSNVSAAANKVRVQATAGATIGGSTEATALGPFDSVVFHAIDSNTWSASVHNISQTWFEWNGVDLTQFDPQIDGSQVTSATVDISANYGVNWIRMNVTADCSSGVPRDWVTLLPLAVTPPSADFAMFAEMYVSTFAAGNRYTAGFLMRAQSTGYGYACFVGDGNLKYIQRWDGLTTNLRTGLAAQYNLTSSSELQDIGAIVRGNVGLLMSSEGLRFGVQSSTTVIESGTAALIAGPGTGGSSSLQAYVRFANIKGVTYPSAARMV